MTDIPADIEKIIHDLNPSHSAVITVVNHSKSGLRRTSSSHDHGDFGKLPADEISAGGSDEFLSVSSAGSVGTGCEGRVEYTAAGDVQWTVHWDNPFIGSNSGDTYLGGSQASDYVAEEFNGGGNEKAPFRFTLTGGDNAVQASGGA
jgi:hypothetical protein